MLSSHVALAQPPEQAVAEEAPAAGPSAEETAYAALVDDALREFGAGHYREAADNFREALALRPSARVLRGLGKALFELGSYVEASAVFERALAHPVDPLTRALREDVEGLLVRSERHIGVLVVQVNPEDAELLLDGRTLAPGPQRVDAGTHSLQARAPEHEPVTRAVRVVAGERQTLELMLERRAAPSVTVVHEARNLRPIVGGVLGGLGVAGVIGSAFWVRDRIDAADACPVESDTATCTNRRRVVAERRASGVALGLGVATVLVGAVLALLPGREAGTDAETTAGCAVRGRGGLCAIAGSF